MGIIQDNRWLLWMMYTYNGLILETHHTHHTHLTTPHPTRIQPEAATALSDEEDVEDLGSDEGMLEDEEDIDYEDDDDEVG